MEVDPRDADGKQYYGHQEEKIVKECFSDPTALSPWERWRPRSETNDKDKSRLKVQIRQLFIALVVALAAIIASATTGGVVASRYQNTIVNLQSQLLQASSSLSTSPGEDCPTNNATIDTSTITTTTTAFDRNFTIPPCTTTAVTTENTTVTLTATDIISATPDTSPSPTPDDDTLPATVHPVTNCSSLSSPYFSDPEGTKFTLYCGADCQSQSVFGIWVYTFQECINTCAEYNRDRDGSRDYDCGSATYSPLHEWRYQKQNCWLKNYTSGMVRTVSDDRTDCAVLWKSQ